MIEALSSFLQKHWQLFFIFIGLLVLLSSIFNWTCICSPFAQNSSGFPAFIYEIFGERGYRILIGIIGIVIMVSGILFLIFKKYYN